MDASHYKDYVLTMSERLGKGFDVGSLRNMRQFYLTFPIHDAVRSELSWTHYRAMLSAELKMESSK